MMEKIINILTKEAIQRTIYGLGLILWTLIMLESIRNFPFSPSSLKISYLTLYLIPAIILIIQILRNNKLLWLLIFTVFSCYILVSVFFLSWDIIERSGNNVKAINWTLKEITIIILFFGFLGVIDWIIYNLKPKRLL
jgi:hypothetical protein